MWIKFACSFRRKISQLCLWPKIHTISDSFWMRQVFNICVWVFCAPNGTILLVYIPTKIKMSFICKSFAAPLSEAKTHWMVNWLQLLNQLDFVWCHTKAFMQNFSQWCLRNVQLLRTTVNWCWWRFKHAFLYNSIILLCTLFFAFQALSMRMPASFTLFTRSRTDGADGDSLLPISVSNFCIYSATIAWYVQSNIAIFCSRLHTTTFIQR